MERIEYQGQIYTRRAGKWVDHNGFVVHEGLQKDLNAHQIKMIDLHKLSVEEMIAYGDKFKESSSFGYAIRFYEYAAKIASEQDLAYILPRITACYRKQGRPQHTIDILAFANKKYGQDMVTGPLLTSVAAAYCDLGEYEKAKKCCNRAFAKSDGKASDQLKLVYARIRKETEK